MKITTQTQDELIYYTLSDELGTQLTLCNYGARVISFKVPFENQPREVLVSGETLEDFKKGSIYFGATIGPVAGRITKGQFKIGDKTYQVTQNEGENTLHGGPKSFDSQLFTGEATESKNQAAVTFTYKRPHLKNGFPGNLTLKVTYTLFENQKYTIHYEAISDEDTVFNPTNHSYFNLMGKPEDISQHQLTINASHYVELKADGIPTGKLITVENTPMDFQKGAKLTTAFSSDYPQIKMKNGIDHPFVFNKGNHEVKLTSPDEKLRLVINTDRDGVVIFTTNFATPPEFSNGKVHFHGAVAIEPQNLPDAMNHEDFGDVYLKKNQVFESETSYQIQTI